MLNTPIKFQIQDFVLKIDSLSKKCYSESLNMIPSIGELSVNKINSFCVVTLSKKNCTTLKNGVLGKARHQKTV